MATWRQQNPQKTTEDNLSRLPQKCDFTSLPNILWTAETKTNLYQSDSGKKGTEHFMIQCIPHPVLYMVEAVLWHEHMWLPVRINSAVQGLYYLLRFRQVPPNWWDATSYCSWIIRTTQSILQKLCNRFPKYWKAQVPQESSTWRQLQ